MLKPYGEYKRGTTSKNQMTIDVSKDQNYAFIATVYENERDFNKLKQNLTSSPVFREKTDQITIEDLASMDAVCIDDLQLLLSNKDWETALFNLINECQQSNCSLILSFGGTHPLEEKTELSDLLSRIKRMEFIALYAVQDEFFNQAIDFVAQQLDIKIEKAELEFLLKHQTRKFSLLVNNILALDKQAASLKRKITIPLIKETLNI